MMESAIEPKSAIAIVMVNADINRGEKVLSAYIFVSIRFDCCWCVGSAVLFLLFCCQC